MKKTAVAILVLLSCVVTSTAQKPSLELTFTANDSATHIQLDSIKVMNRTQGGDTVLYYPDTVLVLDYIVGVEEMDDKEGGLQVYQNYPNPVVESTTISIYLPEKGLVRCLITDILGRIIQHYEGVLESGVHLFSYSPGGGEMSFFTVVNENSRETIKILHPKHNNSSSPSLSYVGMSYTPVYEIKASEEVQGFSFSLGDTLLYIGYANELESGILDDPAISDTISFQFVANIPCLGTPTVTYEGQVYNTIQIFSQCWLKENLNVGTMISDGLEMTDNWTIEKYCYNNEDDNCTVYGGLYKWDEMMQYTSQQGVKGICPQGWHIPTDEEWKILEGIADSIYKIGNSEWDTIGYSRGYDVSQGLKSTSGWWNGGNGTDDFGFSALPGGWRFVDGFFNWIGARGYWWSSSENVDANAWMRSFHTDKTISVRSPFDKLNSLSVRCIKNEVE